MELRGLGGKYNLPGLATDRRSVAADERQAKRLSDMRDAIQRLRSMPSPKALAKQEAASRVAQLKQRLEALKALLLHASPAQARALARELKTIAKELASAAKSLGGGDLARGTATLSIDVSVAGSGESGGAVTAEPSATAGREDGAADEAISAAVPEAVEGGAEASGQKDKADGSNDSAGNSEASSSAGRSDGDQELRALLHDAKKLLKEVVSMLKAKLAQGAQTAKEEKAAREAARDVRAAEKSLANVESALAQGGVGLYSAFSAFGVATTLDALGGGAPSSGANVDVRA